MERTSPCLAVLFSENHVPSCQKTKQLEKACIAQGIRFTSFGLPDGTNTYFAQELIETLNQSSQLDGILLFTNLAEQEQLQLQIQQEKNLSFCYQQDDICFSSLLQACTQSFHQKKSSF